jgi:uncharacterized coiled-coil protein SlyX
VSTERQEPKISLSIDEEDIVHASPQRKTQSAPPPASGGGGFVMFMLTVLVLALTGASYYLYEQLTSAQKQLASGQGRIDVLEQRLSVADESITESSVSTQVKLKELDFEVRKLWDNVWKKQKDELAQHEASLVAQKADLAKAEKRIAALEAKLRVSDEQVAKIVKSYNGG